MSILDVIRTEIRNIILNEEEFEIRQPILMRYKEILDTMVEVQDEGVEAYSLLAMVTHELRMSNQSSIDYLNRCLVKNQGRLSKEEYAIWATNVAYFCLDEGSLQSLTMAKETLKEALCQEILYPQTYYAYARILYEIEEFEEAAKQFHKSYILTKDKKYCYNEAISLIQCSKREQAIALLKEIQCYPFKTKLDARINCVLGQEYIYKGKRQEARTLANQLYASSYRDFHIDEMAMADFMYQIEEYDKAKELYEQCSQYLIKEDWISRYFYVLYRLGLKGTATKKFRAIKKGIRTSLLDVKKNQSLFDEITERDEYIELERQKLKNIRDGYYNVFDKNIRPEFHVDYQIQCFCFYIGCPRHMESEW